jgi:hypothetical protein
MRIFPSISQKLFGQFAGCVFHVANSVVDVALGLVELIFGLKLLVTGDLTDVRAFRFLCEGRYMSYASDNKVQPLAIPQGMHAVKIRADAKFWRHWQGNKDIGYRGPKVGRPSVACLATSQG